MSDQNQILRLLATIREESAEVRRRQEELFELLISYKDQIQDLKATVVDKLSGLPRSPYIAGQLVPAPHKVDGVDDYRELLATYLHKVTGPPEEDPAERPVDTIYEPAPPVSPDSIELEDEDDASDERPRRRGPRRSGPRDNDLERGPDRDVEPFDLSDGDDEDDEEEGESSEGEADEDKGEGEGERGRRRRRRRRRGGRGRGRGDGPESSRGAESGRGSETRRGAEASGAEPASES